MTSDEGSATLRWQHALESLAIPPPILAAAPKSPFGFSVELFARAADRAVQREEASPSTRRALEALPPSGEVLDVGSGAGAASLPLAPPAARLVAVDEGAGMLDAFRERAVQTGAAVETIVGRWPDVAADVPVVDVVVCHHVLYNVPHLRPFLEALTAHARDRVVVELTSVHPLRWMTPFWVALHDYERPLGPTADDAVAVLDEMGVPVRRDDWRMPFMLGVDVLGFLRARLCVGAERDDELRELLARHPVPAERDVVTLSWDGDAPKEQV